MSRSAHRIALAAFALAFAHAPRAFADDEAAATELPALADAAPAPVAPATEIAPAPPPRFTGTRAAALVTGGAGIVALGIGSVAGIAALHARAEAQCASNVCTSPESAASLTRAKSAADVTTVAFLAGAALLAGGVTLWIVARPSPSKASLEIAPTIGGIVARGRF